MLINFSVKCKGGIMEYKAYKLKFLTGVHFGKGSLDDTSYAFCADTLFSALCIEALKDSRTEA